MPLQQEAFPSIPSPFTHPPPLYSSLPQQLLAPAGALPPPFPPLFSHCRSSAAPAGASSPHPPPFPFPNSPPTPPRNPPHSCFSHYRSECLPLAGTFSPFSPLPPVVLLQTGFFSSYVPTAPAVDRSRRSAIYFSHYRSSGRSAGALSLFPTAPSSAAPAGAFPSFPHAPACLLQQARYLYSSLPQ